MNRENNDNKDIKEKKEVKKQEVKDIEKKVKEEKIEKIKDQREEILEKTGREYFSSALDEEKKGRYNSAVVLYFKSLASFADLFILKKTGKSPSSHSDRFRITREKFPEIYDLLDKDFPFYQDSYNKIMSKELAEVIKNDTKIVAEKAEVKL